MSTVSASSKTRNCLPFAVAAVLLCTLFIALSCTGIAWASSNSDCAKNADNLFGSSSNDGHPALSDEHIERDLYWAGANLTFSSIETGGDIVVAGMNLDLHKSKANGSVRMAGMNLTLAGVDAKSNFTLAGQNIELDSCTAAGGIYCAAEKVSFDGKANGGFFAADKVYLNGQINGDANVSCTELELGPNAIITGVLKVEAEEQPTIAKSASIGKLEFEDTSAKEDAAANSAGAGLAGLAALGSFAIVSKAVGLVGTIVLALLLVWLLRRPVEGATAMTRKNAGRIFATGAIAAIAAPALIILLLCLVVTIPVAFALALALVVLAIVSTSFAAASLSRLVLPKMNRFGAAALGALVLGIVDIIPFVGMIVTLAAFMFVVGYTIQVLWEGRHEQAEPDEDTMATAPVAPETPGVPVAPVSNDAA